MGVKSECSICAGINGVVPDTKICYQCLPIYIAGGMAVVKQLSEFFNAEIKNSMRGSKNIYMIAQATATKTTLEAVIEQLEKMEKSLDEHLQK